MMVDATCSLRAGKADSPAHLRAHLLEVCSRHPGPWGLPHASGPTLPRLSPRPHTNGLVNETAEEQCEQCGPPELRPLLFRKGARPPRSPEPCPQPLRASASSSEAGRGCSRDALRALQDLGIDGWEVFASETWGTFLGILAAESRGSITPGYFGANIRTNPRRRANLLQEDW